MPNIFSLLSDCLKEADREYERISHETKAASQKHFENDGNIPVRSANGLWTTAIHRIIGYPTTNLPKNDKEK